MSSFKIRFLSSLLVITSIQYSLGIISSSTTSTAPAEFAILIGLNTECLGKKAFDNNINNLELEEVINLLDIDLPEYIDKTILIESKPAQASLDILSLLIISKDSYELPLLKFKQYNYLFTNKLENITLIENILINMINDFNDYYNAQLEAGKNKWQLKLST